jgi:flagellar biosynthesis anti-sigma factor FlgM
MKISRSDSQSTSALGRTPGAASTGGSSGPKSATAQNAISDQAQLSSLSAYLAAALDGSAAQVAKVNELTAAVSSGQYQVNANAVSESLIQHSLVFGGSGYFGLST